jgi:putative NADPH-quinone reductase
MKHVLVISGHPDLQASWANSLILDRLETRLSNTEIRRLDRLYSDAPIDVEQEQAALQKADVVVLQFPFYWYSVPALLKKWLDEVLTFNFAYGPEGDKLKGKDFLLSFTIGGPEDSYQPLGYNHFTIEQLIHPLQQTAYLAGMHFNAPLFTHRMVYIPGVYNTQEEVEARAEAHAGRLTDVIESLCHLRSIGK